MSRTRVLLADDHRNMRDRVVSILEPDFEVVGVVRDGYSLVEAESRIKPDVCILDISMPIMGGLEAAAQLKKSGSTAKIVFLSVHEDRDFVEAAIELGALGYVVKSRMASDLHTAIRGAMAEQVFISSSCTSSSESGSDGQSEW